jgi:hypothetical protein
MRSRVWQVPVERRGGTPTRFFRSTRVQSAAFVAASPKRLAPKRHSPYWINVLHIGMPFCAAMLSTDEAIMPVVLTAVVEKSVRVPSD